jgi:hypothetical protein
MLLLDLVLCVVAGQPWLEGQAGDQDTKRYDIPQAEPAHWIDLDNGTDRLERRLAALGLGHQVPNDAPFAYVSFPSPPFVASDPASAQTVIDAVQKASTKLVVFDNLGTISGGADENSSQMVAVMAGLRRIAEDGRCAVIVIHHKSKGDRARVGDSLRGHSSIESAVDLALLVHREDGEDTITLQSTKTRDIPVQPFSALWSYEQDANGELTKGRFFGLGKPESAALSKQQQAEICILAELTDGMSQTEIVKLVSKKASVGRNTTRAALRRLVDGGKLYARVGGANNAIEYERAQTP